MMAEGPPWERGLLSGQTPEIVQKCCENVFVCLFSGKLSASSQLILKRAHFPPKAKTINV